MRVSKAKQVRQWATDHASAAAFLNRWLAMARKAHWQSFADVRLVCPSADQVRVTSHRTVLIFNIARNDFRLIVAAHFDRARLYTLRFMTHTEYSKNRWKTQL